MAEKKYFVEFGKTKTNNVVVPFVCESDEKAVEIACAIYNGSSYRNCKSYCEVFDADVAEQNAKGFYKVISDCM